MKKAFLAILIILIICPFSIAEYGSRIYCNHTYSIHYSPVTNMIYLGGSQSQGTYCLIAIDPNTLEMIYEPFSLEGGLQQIIPIDIQGTYHLLVLLTETDGDPTTYEGKLQYIDSTTGDVLPGYELTFNQTPLDFVVDNNHNYAYVTSGMYHREPSIISKINLSTFKLDCFTEFGKRPDQIEISNDGSNIFVKNTELYLDDIEDPIGEPEYYNHLGVFNTSDLSPSVDGNINMSAIMYSCLRVGSDNKLFISNASCFSENNTNNSIIVVDTSLNEIIHTLSFDDLSQDTGAWDIEFSPDKEKLFCTVWLRDYYDEELESFFHVPSNKIIGIALSDYSYNLPPIVLGDEPLWDIIVTYNVSPEFEYRIFGITANSPVVYYIDVE